MRQDVESFADFCQYYTDHFVKDRDPNIIYYVAGALNDRTVRMQRYSHGRKTPDHVDMSWDTILNTVLFGLPRIGTIVYKNELLYLYYRADRNGGRGYDPRRISYTSFNSWLLLNHNYPTFQADTLYEPHFAYLATRNAHTPWAEAAADLLGESPKTPAYALSYNFGLYLGSAKHPTLTYKSTTVGEVLELNLIKLVPGSEAYKTTIRNTLDSSILFS